MITLIFQRRFWLFLFEAIITALTFFCNKKVIPRVTGWRNCPKPVEWWESLNLRRTNYRSSTHINAKALQVYQTYRATGEWFPSSQRASLSECLSLKLKTLSLWVSAVNTHSTQCECLPPHPQSQKDYKSRRNKLQDFLDYRDGIHCIVSVVFCFSTIFSRWLSCLMISSRVPLSWTPTLFQTCPVLPPESPWCVF